jgi:uncharacterized protein
MISEAQVLALQSNVVWAIFAVSLALGIVMARSNFCTMGAVSDIVNMSDWTRMRMWLFAIAVAILGTALLAQTGTIQLSKSIYLSGKITWLSNVVGGALFGFGMVLASGCGSKTLVRMGGGSLKSLTVFIVMGIFAYMTMRGIFGVWRTNFLDPVFFDVGAGKDLGTLIGTSLGAFGRTIVAAVIGLSLVGFCLKDREFRRTEPLLSALLVGLAVVAAWYISGSLGFVAEDPKSLEELFVGTNSNRMESFSFVAPAAYTLELLMLWSDKTRVVSFGIAATLGMIVGSLAYAIVSRTFRWEGFNGTEDTANHIVGAALMGIGGVTALGCTVGQGLTGLSTLAIGSFIAFAAILIGAYLGLKYQTWRVEQMV